MTQRVLVYSRVFVIAQVKHDSEYLKVTYLLRGYLSLMSLSVRHSQETMILYFDDFPQKSEDSESVWSTCLLNINQVLLKFQFSFLISIHSASGVTVLSLPNYLAFSLQYCKVNTNQPRILKVAIKVLRQIRWTAGFLMHGSDLGQLLGNCSYLKVKEAV